MEDNDGFMNQMGTTMNMKFEKVAYTKLHGKDSEEFKCVRDTLASLFYVYSENLSHLLHSNYGMNEATNHTECGDTIFR
ncbi:unnamed protein product [Prunus armeniaca]|uniref:Uncharacterized protein n=1 Tax=Prunus armeniaca TaxID=36596 RepID=A0A6J5V5Q3_PRUAR|nr:unnamed protein product [Prunus armeniaca]